MPLEKENGEKEKGGQQDASGLLDAASLFAYWPRGDASGAGSAASGLFGGGFHPGYGGRGSAYLPTSSPHAGSTLSVAASQAASLGINPASAAWWTMASHLAAQDYLARLQGGLSFMPGGSDLYPMMTQPHTTMHSHHGSSGKSSGKYSSGGSKANTTTTMAMSLPLLAAGGGLPQRDRERDSHREHKRERDRERERERERERDRAEREAHHPPAVVSDPSGILGGVRLPPDTEIIKYTSSIVGPKVPGTTNRGRKKTISLDPPSVSVLPSLSSTGMPIERNRGRRSRDTQPHRHLDSMDFVHRSSPSASASDRVEVIKLPAHNGTSSSASSALNIPSFGGSADSDAPLNLSLKPGSASSSVSTPLQALALTVGSQHERSRRKGGSGGARPRRVVPTGGIPASPSPSLAQLFAAADSPRPSSGSEENDSQHKDGRPRNLGRGVSKPKKNTVASLLAQSRALGIKPMQGLELSPLNHQVSLLKSNILAARHRQQMAEAEDEIGEDCDGYGSEGLRKALATDKAGKPTLGSDSSAGEVSSDSCSDDSESEEDLSEAGSKRDGDESGPANKRRKTEVEERELRVPLEHGWRRETVISGVSRVGALRGEVTYYSPCGRRFKQISDVARYLEKHSIGDMSRENFCFSAKVLLGEFLQPGAAGDEMTRLTDEQVLRRLDELRLERGSGTHRLDSTRDQKLALQVERERLAHARRVAKEETARAREHSRLMKEQERCERQEAQRREREQRNQQMMEEREVKRQQAVQLKEQLYMQELNKQREMLYTVELERERRRQHMTLVKALESRKRQEERERKRQEMRAEKMASKERKIEQRRVELELVRELRKPAEDMELTDQKSLPVLNRIPGLKLSGQAFADTLMVFEFLHNFGETLGFDMESLPSLNSLQMALLNDEEAEEELLSVMTHLLVCAIEDPGIPNPARHTTILGQSLKQADITHANLSEILRVYLYANATGEVKALTGLYFERDREKKSDHHNSLNDSALACGKNTAFFEHLHTNPTWLMSARLNDLPFLALNPTHKSAILAFLCNELLANKAVLRQLEGSIENASQLRKERWLHDTRARKLRMMHARKCRQATLPPTTAAASSRQEGGEGEEEEVEEEVGEDVGTSGAESDTATQPEEEEDRNLSVEELARKLDKVNKQHEASILSLSHSSQQLRATCLGQDRYWRRFWALPCAGAVFIEAMESAAPDVYTSDAEDEPVKPEPDQVKSEPVDAKPEPEEGKLELEVVKSEPEEVTPTVEEDKPEAVIPDEEMAEVEKLKTVKQVEKMDVVEQESVKPEPEVVSDEVKLEVVNSCESSEVKAEAKAEINCEDVEMKNESNELNIEVEKETKQVKVDSIVDVEEKVIENKKGNEIVSNGQSEIEEVVENAKNEHRKIPTRLEDDKEVESVKEEKMEVDAIVKSDKAEEEVSAVKAETEKDTLSAVKVEIKSDVWGAELKSEKESSPMSAPNGDKFTALNHLYGLNTTVFGKEMNGTERNWFSVLPRDACDATSVTNGLSNAMRFSGACASELRIPVFPPPSRLSPSPGGSQCDSPGPLVLTPEEAAQLEYMKKTGGFMEPLPARPVPCELRRGWWRITDQDQLRTILTNLHSRGFRESQLKRILARYMDHTLESCGKLCIVSGEQSATELHITAMDSRVSQLPGGASLRDDDEARDLAVALRVDLGMLDQVETLEDKVANASMQVKGWKVPARATTEDGPEFRPACVPEEEDDNRRNPVEIAKERLISLEAAIERRYLKPPLGISTGDVNLQGMSGELPADDALPKGLVTWREAVMRAHTSAQLAMALYMLEASVAWDKSIMKANCQFCHSGENEDKLLLCDGCDKGYHMYCFKPKMENIPDGDWYCYECMNKATGERNCIVCGKKALGKNLVMCDLCPRAYHCDCLQPPLSKVPRGKWYCPTCATKQPRKRAARRSKPSESSEHTPTSSLLSEVNVLSPAGAAATPPAPATLEESGGAAKAASPPPTPAPASVTPTVRKERGNKKLTKELKPCIKLMEELEAHDEAWPFLLPVNTKQFPTYRKIIKQPMDLSSIKKKLTDNVYKGRDEFSADVRQIFINCETFNEDDSPVGKAGHSMRVFFDARWTEIAGTHVKTTTP